MQRTPKEDALVIRTESAQAPKFRVRESRGLQYFNIDVEDAILGDAPRTQAFPELAFIQEVEFSQAEAAPNGVVRMVVRMKKWTDYKVQTRDGAIWVVFAASAPSAAPAPVSAPAEPAVLPAPTALKALSAMDAAPLPSAAGKANDKIAAMQANVAKPGEAVKSDAKKPTVEAPVVLAEFASSGQPASGATPSNLAAGQAGARVANVSVSGAGSGPMGSMTNGKQSGDVPTDFGSGARRMDKPEDFGLRGGAYDMIVDLDFRDQRVEDVVRLLAAKGSINVLMDPKDVSGNVTLHLAGVPLGVALDNILRVNNLSYVQEPNNILRIVQRKAVGGREVETSTEHIVLNWVKSTDLATTLRPFISNDGQIQANAENNSIIITDTPPNLNIVRNLIAELDVPEKQVMIEMHLVDVAEFYSKSHGVRVSAVEEGETSTNALLSGLITQPFGTLNLDEQIDFLGGNNFDITVQADAGNSHNEVIANPKVITLNNLEAKIEIVENIPFVQGNLEPNSSSPTQQIRFEEAGNIITVTPTITANGYIRMVITVEQKIFRGREGGGDLAPPRIDERNATTNVIVRDGSTITLGGLEGHRMLDTRDGVPWFMDIPVFRWFFQSKTNQIDRTTLYLFVKPKIVPVDAAEITEREKFWYDNVDRSWDLPGRFFDDFSGYWDKYPAP